MKTSLRRSSLILSIMLLGSLFTGCAQTASETQTDTQIETQTAAPEATSAETQETTPSEAPDEAPADAPTQASGENPQIAITMENGDVIRAELYPDIAPITVENFLKLVNENFYDGLIFHRVIPGFMIQGGDPDGNGTGGPGWQIKGEFSANGVDNPVKHERGVLSMARSTAPDSAGSQFFIMVDDADFLDGEYAAFGKVLDETSMAAVDKIVNADRDPADKPLEDQRIATIRVIEN